MTILLVDDERVALRLLQLTLERAGYRVALVGSAEDALAWLHELNPVEMVITDHHMGGITGVELYSMITADTRWHDVPVILCTGAADRETVDQALRAGVRHFLVKPIRPAPLLERIVRAAGERTPTLPASDIATRKLGMSEPRYRRLLAETRARLAELNRDLRAVRGSPPGEIADITRQMREVADAVSAIRLVRSIDEWGGLTDPDPRGATFDRIVIEVGVLDEALEVGGRLPLLGPRHL